jgi:glycyl-tRNA synthetase beta chain
LPLLVEIGCEEIPARFLAAAQRDFGEQLQEALREAVLLVGVVRESPLQTYSTPRRLVAHVAEVLAHQPDKLEEIRGPAVKAAFDAKGGPTRAAESFAAKNNATVEELVRVSTPKGEYVAVQKHIRGRPAIEVLPEVLPSVITGLSFPKSMYWEKSKTHFIRPIRWVLAVLGGGETAQVVPFEIAGVKSGNVTYGHRGVVNLSSGTSTPGRTAGAFRASTETRPFGAHAASVNSFPDYATKLRGLGVEFDPEARRRSLMLALHVLPVMPHVKGIQDMGHEWHTLEGSDLEERLQELSSRIKALPEIPELRVVEDKELEDWVVNSTECPNALMGSFQERFLELPREILVTVMRDHQKYFALEDKEGKLRPRFVASLNLDSDPKGFIRAGHERVLTARFSDAGFFWKADQKILLCDRLPMLERVIYQAKLGSYADKVRRMEAIAKAVCTALESQGKITGGESGHVLRAIQLCKCDLTTQMVQEFTELQGVVGGLYAAAQGEPNEVADAVYDQYKPQGAEDECPRSVVGSVVSLVDKVDSVVAGFSVGLAPTGSSDPFALRRHGNGIIRLLTETEFPISLGQLSQYADEALEQAWSGVLRQVPRSTVLVALCGFFEDRLRYYLETVRRLRYDTVRAVLGTGPAAYLASGTVKEVVPLDALERALAVEQMRGSEDFLAVCAAAKRTRNILTKSATGSDWQPGGPAEEWLKEEAEKELYRQYRRVNESDLRDEDPTRYAKFLKMIASLRPVVDEFFDKVLVMDEDRNLRQNRLRLLAALNERFSMFADLSQIESVTSGFVGASTSRNSGE